MSKEPQTSVSDQVGERTASGGCSDFHIRHMASMVSSVPTCQNARAVEFCCGPCLAPIQQDRDYVSLVKAYFGIQSSLMLDFQILFFLPPMKNPVHAPVPIIG